MFSQRFSFPCLCSRVFFHPVLQGFCPFEGCKAVSIATLCNAELGPLGYKNEVGNCNGVYAELSNTGHCYFV